MMNNSFLTSQLLVQLETAGISLPSNLQQYAEDKCKEAQIYYYSDENRFYYLQSGGVLAGAPWHGFDCTVRASGISIPKEDTHVFMEELKAQVIKNHGVDIAIPLAGHPAGYSKLKDGTRLLSTKGFKMVTPTPGNCDCLLDYLWEFCGGRSRPYNYLLGWLQIAVKDGMRCLEFGVEKARLRPSQLLAIVGPPGAGKTLLVTLISELFDGTIRNPYPAFSGTTAFKGDLASAVLLVMDDSAESVRSVARHKLASNIKEFLVVPQRRFEAKFKNGFTAPTFQRVIMLGNEDSLGVFPAPQADFLDKYALIRAYPSDDVLAQRDDEEKEQWVEQFRQALPAFAHYLLHDFKIPDSMVDSRYGVKAFQDPDLLIDLSHADTDQELLRCLQQHYAEEGNPVVSGTVTWEPISDNPKRANWCWEGFSKDFESLVRALPVGQGWSREFRNRHAAGLLLKSLSENYPTKVERGKKSHGQRKWLLHFEGVSRSPKAKTFNTTPWLEEEHDD